MNLILDIGNTSTKLAIFKGKERISVSRISELSCEEIETRLSGLKVEKAIVSSVRKLPPYISDLLSANLPSIHFLSYSSRFPFEIDYETPDTLGTDRLAGVCGACNLYPGKDLLVIDAGTAITYDFLTNNRYKGGNISPGLEMRFKALNCFTSNLPLVSLTENFSLSGRNTIDAIRAGVITGVSYEINEYIRTFEKEHTGLITVLTGGNSGFLKNRIHHQFTYMPDIVLDGLNYILEYNAK